MGIDEQITYWREGSEYDLTVADSLFEKGHFTYCLFMGHLALEKMLKAIYVSAKTEFPPRTHNLISLAKLSGLAISTEQELFLFRVNSFNIEARYPEEKREFFKLCTREFTQEHLSKIKETWKWLRSLLPF